MKRSLILALIASPVILAAKCNPNNAPDFNWEPKIYAADSRSQTIIRGNHRVSTKDEAFDNFICLPATDIAGAKKAYREVVEQCAKWKHEADAERQLYLLERSIPDNN